MEQSKATPDNVGSPEAVPAPVWPAFTVLAVTLTVMMGVSVVPFAIEAIRLVLAKRPFPSQPSEFFTPGVVIFSLALSQGALLLCTRVLPRLLGDEGHHGFWQRVQLRWDRFSWVEATGLTLLCLGASQLFGTILFEWLQLPISDTLRALSDAFLKTSLPVFVVATLLISLAPALGEELLFRGYAQHRFVARWGGTTGPILASLLFSAYHMDPVHVLATLPISFLLGFGAKKSGTIAHGMVAHAVNNFVASVLSRFEPTAFLSAHSWLSPSMSLILALCGGAILSSRWRGDPSVTAARDSPDLNELSHDT
jgi:uncharacterized protein